jgi:hypothetical protein
VFQDVKIDPFTSLTMIKVTFSVNDILTMDFTYVLAMIYVKMQSTMSNCHSFSHVGGLPMINNYGTININYSILPK